MTTARGLERVQAVDIFRERVLLRAEDGTVRVVSLAVLKEETAAVPPIPKAEPAAPSSLTTFDEVDAVVTPEQAVESLTPKPRRKRRRRGRRGGSGRHRRPPGDDEPRTNGPKDDPPDGQ